MIDESAADKLSRHDKNLAKSHLRDLGAAIGVYALLLVVSLTFGRQMSDTPLRTALFLVPALGIAAVIWAIARSFGRMDEYQRQHTLESIAIASAITMGATFTYGFLENAGFPQLSMFSILPLMCALWGVVGCVRASASK